MQAADGHEGRPEPFGFARERHKARMQIGGRHAALQRERPIRQVPRRAMSRCTRLPEDRLTASASSKICASPSPALTKPASNAA